MQPKITKIFFLSLVICTSLFFSCKKQLDSNLQRSALIEAKIRVLNDFLVMLEVKADDKKDAKIRDFKQYLKVENLTTFFDSAKNEFVAVRLSKEQERNPTDKFLVLKLTKEGVPLWGLIASYSESNKEKNIAKVFSSFLNNTSVSNGVYTVYDYDETFYFEVVYQKNRITKTKSISKNNGVTARSQDVCIDWYLVTTYYYADGTTERETEYVTSTCYGECPPTLMCYTEGMAANSSNPPPTVVAQVDWVVGTTLSWYVKSYETLSGVKDINIPGGGYFTSSAHAGDGIFNISGVQTWQRFAVTNAAQGWTASVSIAGKVMCEGLPDQELNKSNIWSLTSVWP